MVVMQTDPLQQLRDVHSPPDPSWWPPAVGWWLLGICLAAALIWACWRLWQRWRLGAPLRAARQLHANNYIAYHEGRLTMHHYLHETNELLKRLLVRGYHHDVAPLSGSGWLEALDRISDSHEFSQGPGQVLGNPRFSINPEFDPQSLHTTVKHLLSHGRIQH